MKNISKIFILVQLLIYQNLFSQGLGDAVRFSQTSFGGTARFNSMAGSMSALGGDISCIATNPAGIAVFRKSEFTFSPSLYLNTTSTTYMGTNTSDGKFNFNFGNIGYVGSKDVSNNGTGWQSISWAIGYNRMNNFHRRISVEGFNSSSSMVDVFLKNAQGINYNNLDPFTSELAFNAFLIDTLPGSVNKSNYYKLFPPQQGMNQSKYLTSSGSMGETGFSFAGNFMNKLYIGGSLGYNKIRYNETSEYREYKNKSDTAFSLNNFTYSEDLSSRGTGVNFKLGIIYRPLDWIRIGGALHTPTYYSMSDDYVVSLRSQFDQNYNYSPSAKASSFNYSIVTPARAIASIGFVIAKKGLINAEYEHIDYRTTRFFPSRDFNGLNSVINNSLQISSNVKLGAEIRFDPFVIRGGYAIYDDPYSSKSSFTSLKNFITGGVGYRTNNWYVDFAFVFNSYKTNYYLYDPSFVQAAQNKYLNQSLISTIGFRF